MDEKDFLSVLKELKSPIREEYFKFLPEAMGDKHYEMVRDYPIREGKYLRGVLILLACEAFGGDWKKAVRTAAAMQASEDWILIHDDFEDGSDERRGKPCLHKIYGPELAVNAGDGLHAIMWKILLANREILGDNLTFKILDKMYVLMERTTEGQTFENDMTLNTKIDNLTEENVFKNYDFKTGWYTIIGPLQFGAIIAGAGEKELKKIVEFGIPFGRAFQIQDDWLNLTAGEKYGKEIGGDILEGKRTIMLAHLLKNCTMDEKKKLSEIYSRKRNEKTLDDVKFVIELMKKYGSLDYSAKTAKEFAEDAKRGFDKLAEQLPDTPAKKHIRNAIDFVVNRDH